MSVRRHQPGEIEVQRRRRRLRLLTRVDEFHETTHQPVTASGGSRGPATSGATGSDTFVGALREPLEATDTRRRREFGQGPPGLEAGQCGKARQS